jgi:hypothetical protein
LKGDRSKTARFHCFLWACGNLKQTLGIATAPSVILRPVSMGTCTLYSHVPNMDKASQALAHGVPTGVSRSYRTAADHGKRRAYRVLWLTQCRAKLRNSQLMQSRPMCHNPKMMLVRLALVLEERQSGGCGDLFTWPSGFIRTGDCRNGSNCGPPNNIVDGRIFSAIE